MHRLLLIIISVVLAISMALAPARAQAQRPQAVKEDMILAIQPGVAIAASFPGSQGDPGGSLAVTNVLYEWGRNGIFQARIDATVLAVWGSEQQQGYMVVAPQAVLQLYFGSVLGYEIGIGAGGIMQVGQVSQIGAGMFGSGAYTFRFWRDERRRLKLGIQFFVGSYFADDQGNDLGFGAGIISGGIGYESSF